MITKSKKNIKRILGVFIFLEVLIIFLSFSSFLPFVTGEVGTPNATVQTFLEVGESFPEILNITIDDYANSITLNANSTKTVVCSARIVDYNWDTSLENLSAVLYDASSSSPVSPDNNNDHYTNDTCVFNLTYSNWNGYTDDDQYKAIGICTFDVWYYANSSDWNCSMTVTDNVSLSDTRQANSTIDPLLAVALPDSINYGRVNATYVSNETIANVSNAGNIQLNLSLEGYAVSEGDGLAMNCSAGRDRYISVEYEKYNLTDTTLGGLSLTSFENLYVNLTSDAVVERFELAKRTDNLINDAIKESYWRIYVPSGAAGSCQGNIIFGATVASP